MREKLHIVKIGGNVIDDEKALEQFLINFAGIKGKKILVHGGGKLATDLAGKLGVSQVMWQGRRVTDAQTLKIAVMVYAGWISKTLVASLQALQISALGVCGADLGLIHAVKRPKSEIDFGYVGDIYPDSVHLPKLIGLLESEICPVFSPITADASGQLLNTNADTIASCLAVALSKQYRVQLNYCFEKKGVLTEIDNDDSFVRKLNLSAYRTMMQGSLISKGMIPKLESSFEALKSGVSGIYIGHFSNLIKMTEQHEDAGTAII